ncbi:right-handed parallel beta-helix repeat-containing protein [Mucilaginibacter sp. SJ]|uniref:right-handed parallel beta-helix repeat-containing protein n=1 Tax=Mucilaginibacter sp. SJ TaxID=3029053 RepID=UPI0023A9C98E|nr:right-handed parallel beta-helix repeat-containing protein [Mucilaginibacter sp. SJ]WEA00872.1 right-handed parallel beta-helix repeat-containing protein [Mucilaginibacter sp. SJ]
MKKLRFLFLLLPLIGSLRLQAQILYVDPAKGKEAASGSATDPLLSLEKAVTLAGSFTGEQPVTIKLAPGLYVVAHEMIIKTAKNEDDHSKLTIEAVIMPDDPDWQPAKMPVIQSVSPNNSEVQFIHCVGFLVAKNNVSFKGLKFVGNSHPEVPYYYPITREDENLNGLEVSQCYFIGEKNAARLQSGLWTHGAGIHVDHCIFYNCRNAMVLIKGIKDFSLTNSIIYGAYESGIWYGLSDAPFVFDHNIVTHCKFFWVRPDKTQPAYTFSNSLITENDGYLGYISNELIPAITNNLIEKNIKKTGKVLLVEIKTEKQQPHNYLNLAPGSAGSDIPAGIFKNDKK